MAKDTDAAMAAAGADAKASKKVAVPKAKAGKAAVPAVKTAKPAAAPQQQQQPKLKKEKGQKRSAAAAGHGDAADGNDAKKEKKAKRIESAPHPIVSFRADYAPATIPCRKCRHPLHKGVLRMAKITRASREVKRKDARHDWLHIECFAAEMPEEISRRPVELAFGNYPNLKQEVCSCAVAVGRWGSCVSFGACVLRVHILNSDHAPTGDTMAFRLRVQLRFSQLCR